MTDVVQLLVIQTRRIQTTLKKRMARTNVSSILLRVRSRLTYSQISYRPMVSKSKMMYVGQ